MQPEQATLDREIQPRLVPAGVAWCSESIGKGRTLDYASWAVPIAQTFIQSVILWATIPGVEQTDPKDLSYVRLALRGALLHRSSRRAEPAANPAKSGLGQIRKYSQRVDIFRSSPDSGLRASDCAYHISILWQLKKVAASRSAPRPPFGRRFFAANWSPREPLRSSIVSDPKALDYQAVHAWLGRIAQLPYWRAPYELLPGKRLVHYS
jgi:hypothetical protein